VHSFHSSFPRSPATQPFTGQFTIGEAVKGFENITSQTKLNVETVHKLLEDRELAAAYTASFY
jgi:hypothetical protein